NRPAASPARALLGATAALVLLGITAGVGRAQPGAPQGPLPPAPAPSVGPPTLPALPAPPLSGDPAPPPVAPPPPLPSPPVPAPPRFQFTIDPQTPPKDPRPVPPKAPKQAGPVLSADLAQVPEVQFQAPLPRDANGNALKETAHTVAKINHLNHNSTQADGFLEKLLNN